MASTILTVSLEQAVRDAVVSMASELKRPLSHVTSDLIRSGITQSGREDPLSLATKQKVSA